MRLHSECVLVASRSKLPVICRKTHGPDTSTAENLVAQQVVEAPHVGARKVEKHLLTAGANKRVGWTKNATRRLCSVRWRVWQSCRPRHRLRSRMSRRFRGCTLLTGCFSNALLVCSRVATRAAFEGPLRRGVITSKQTIECFAQVGYLQMDGFKSIHP